MKRITLAGRFAAYFGRQVIARRKRRCDSGYVRKIHNDPDDRQGWYRNWHTAKKPADRSGKIGYVSLKTVFSQILGTPS